MNNTLFHTPYFLLNYITVLILYLPVIAMLINRECRKSKFLPVAGVFVLFLVSALLNNGLPNLGQETANLATTLALLLHAPLTLAFLLFFAGDEGGRDGLKRAIRVSLAFYLATGIGVFAWYGLDARSGAIITGLGFLLVLVFSLPIFFRQIRDSINQRIETGKAFMISAIVFSFGCHGLIFLMYSAFSSMVRQDELFLLFQLTTILFSLLMTTGLLLYKPYVKTEAPPKKTSQIPMLTEWEEYPRR
jgi:hypothetical protein